MSLEKFSKSSNPCLVPTSLRAGGRGGQPRLEAPALAPGTPEQLIRGDRKVGRTIDGPIQKD